MTRQVTPYCNPSQVHIGSNYDRNVGRQHYSCWQALGSLGNGISAQPTPESTEIDTVRIACLSLAYRIS